MTKCPPQLKIAGLISGVHVSVGLLFWTWSILLWAHDNDDSGIFLFLLPIVTGIVGFRIVYLRWRDYNDLGISHRYCSTPPIKCWCVLLLLTHVVITIVYAFAGARAVDMGRGREWQLYCQIAAVCWATSGTVVSGLACCYRKDFLGRDDEESQASLLHQNDEPNRRAFS